MTGHPPRTGQSPRSGQSVGARRSSRSGRGPCGQRSARSARFKAWLAVLLGVGFLLTSSPLSVSADDTPKSQAQQKKERREKRKKQRRDKQRAEAKPPKKSEPSQGPKRESETPARGAGPALRPEDAARVAAQEAAHGVDAEIVKEGDTSVKVMKFTGLDIEGRLKSPQLLYFVNRVHAEFERPKLPHRSFMPELERSTERDPFR